MREFLPTSPKARRRLWLGAMAALIGVLVIGGNTIARAEDDDEETFEEKIIKDILGGLGVNVGRQNGINYQERPPLVIPPTRDLPPPDTTGSVVNNPAWPVNAETKKKKKKTDPIQARNNLPIEAGGYRKDESTPDESRRDASAGAGRVTKPNPDENLDPGRVLRPSELGESSSGPGWFNFGSILGYKNEEQAPFKGEPPRSNLVQPPEGYMTPSPQYPYGINPDNKPAAKAADPMDRGTGDGTSR